MLEIRSVLLSGAVSSSNLEQVFQEIGSLGFDAVINLVIDSCDLEGDLEASVHFVTKLNSYPNSRIELKIYKAVGPGVYIATGVRSSYREMRRNITLDFNRGETTLNLSQVALDTTIDPNVIRPLRLYAGSLQKAMKEVGCRQADLDQFHKNGRLVLNADECLDRGIVQALF